MAAILNDYKYTGKQVPMEEIRVLSMTCGTRIAAIRTDTFKIFTPGLVENAEHIKSIAPKTESYGSHARHKVDIYECAKQHEGGTTGPILIYFYGGGMTRGNRIIDTVPHGLVYNNVGTFFAGRGITTLIPDYRRVDSKKGGEGATYPSGGEDLATLFSWLQNSELLARGSRDVYILGDSVGATHVATFLLDNQFLEQRRGFVSSSKGYVQGALETVGVAKSFTLKGAVLLGMPSHFAEVSKDRQDHFKAYWGNADKAEQFSPFGLLSSLPADSTTSLLALPHIVALVGEFDPQDEVVHPTTDFVKKFDELFGKKAIDFKVLTGHNHLSPIAALMSGDLVGEEWGEELAAWILNKPVVIDEGVKSILRGPTKARPGSDFDRHGKAIGHKDQHLSREDNEKDNDEKIDLNREEGGEGGEGKAEKKVKDIETNEHITPKDTGA